MIPDISIIFRLNSERLTLAFRRVPFSAWSDLKRQLGFTPKTLLEALDDVDVEAIGALIWLERKQHDRRLDWSVVRRELEVNEVEFDLVDMLANGESLAGEEPEAEADPTDAGNS